MNWTYALPVRQVPWLTKTVVQRTNGTPTEMVSTMIWMTSSTIHLNGPTRMAMVTATILTETIPMLSQVMVRNGPTKMEMGTEIMQMEPILMHSLQMLRNGTMRTVMDTVTTQAETTLICG